MTSGNTADGSVTARRLVGGGRTSRALLGWVIAALFGSAAVVTVTTGGLGFTGLDGLLVIPLIAAALAGLGIGVYGLVATTAQEIELLLIPARPVLGEDLELQWTVNGPVDRVKSLELSLSAERYRLRQGQVDSGPQQLGRHRIAFVRGEEVRGGVARFRMPLRADPSGKRGDRQVIWTLRATMRVEGGVDARDRYEVTVVSHGQGAPGAE